MEKHQIPKFQDGDINVALKQVLDRNIVFINGITITLRLRRVEK